MTFVHNSSNASIASSALFLRRARMSFVRHHFCDNHACIMVKVRTKKAWNGTGELFLASWHSVSSPRAVFQNKRLILGFLAQDTVLCLPVGHSGTVVALFFTVLFIIYLIHTLIWRVGLCFVAFRLEILLLISLVCMLLAGILPVMISLRN